MAKNRFIPALLQVLALIVAVSYVNGQATTLPTNTVMDNLVQLAPIIGTKMAPLLNHPLTIEATNRLRSPITRNTIFVPSKEAMEMYNIGFNDSTKGSNLFKHHVIPK